MVIILLIIAFICYICLYFLWQAAQPYASAPPPAAHTLLESLLMPQSVVFMLLRGLILITFLYLVSDALMSWGKRRRLRRRREREDAAERAATESSLHDSP